jgi:hypothetical protein
MYLCIRKYACVNLTCSMYCLQYVCSLVLFVCYILNQIHDFRLGDFSCMNEASISSCMNTASDIGVQFCLKLDVTERRISCGTIYTKDFWIC